MASSTASSLTGAEPSESSKNNDNNVDDCGEQQQQQLHNRLYAEFQSDLIKHKDKMDDLSIRIRQEALNGMLDEPELTLLLQQTILADGVVTFDDAVAQTVTYRLLGYSPSSSSSSPTTSHGNNNNSNNLIFCPYDMRGILARALQSPLKEGGHTMAEAIRADVLAVLDRDPACDTVLEVVLFTKGYAALVSHRAAYRQWRHSTTTTKNRRSLTALFLQSQASAQFGVDIHPAAQIGSGILFDHGTGIVIGETATIGDGCTLLHGVTLGGTGKDHGDRHPKVGNDVLIGANASILGNIRIGNASKIGAGSIVLGPIPSGATAVGAPAKIIGRNKDNKPGSTMDELLKDVQSNAFSRDSANDIHSVSGSMASLTETTLGSTTVTSDDDDDEEGDGIDVPSSNTEGNKDLIGQEVGVSHDDNNNNNKPKLSNSTFGQNNNNNNPCCPFRDYTAIRAPKGTITICKLHKMLQQQGCRNDNEVGETFFALDKDSKGYIYPKDLITSDAMEILSECTTLSQEKIEALVDKIKQNTHTQEKRVKKLVV